MKIGNDEFQEQGLYLVFPDSTRIDLTKPVIEKVTRDFWDDPDKLPAVARAAVDFKRCVKCPLFGTEDICDALRPVLSLVSVFDNYASFDKVTAFYKEDGQQLHISETTMQEAMRHVSILSLTQYCRYGAKYRRYFWGIMPLMKGREMAVRLYLNIYTLHEGNKEAVDAVLSNFREDITMTTSNQVKRLGYMTKSDVLPNAFVSTQVITEILNLDIAEAVRNQFNPGGTGLRI